MAYSQAPLGLPLASRAFFMIFSTVGLGGERQAKPVE